MKTVSPKKRGNSGVTIDVGLFHVENLDHMMLDQNELKTTLSSLLATNSDPVIIQFSLPHSAGSAVQCRMTSLKEGKYIKVAAAYGHAPMEVFRRALARFIQLDGLRGSHDERQVA